MREWFGDLWSFVAEPVLLLLGLGAAIGVSIPIAMLIEAGQIVEAVTAFAGAVFLGLVLYAVWPE